MNKKRSPIVTFLLVSVLVHILLFLFFHKSLTDFLARPIPQPQPVMVRLNPPAQPQNMVDMAKPEREKIPEKPSAESLYNQSVPEETVASGLPPQEASVPSPETAPQKQPQEKPSPDRTDLSSKPSPFDEYAKEVPMIQPRSTAFQKPRDGGDYLPDYKVGGRTYLNTLANPNLAYYVELKRKFKMTWNPFASLRGKVNQIAAGQVDVVLGVTINARGELADLIVIQSSGIAAYDAEGKRTVRQSAPFTTPPSHLLGEDGMLHMAWHFLVYL